jgi:phage gp29-like protein
MKKQTQYATPMKSRKEQAPRSMAFDFNWYAGYLPNPDVILRQTGQTQKVYETILTDDQVTSVINSRLSGTRNKMWQIDKGNASARVYKYVKENFEYINVYKTITEMGKALQYGYVPFELMYKPENGQIKLESIVSKPSYWFRFDLENKLLFITKNNHNGENVNDDKFIIVKHGDSYENPYGEALLSKCYWPTSFKKAGLKNFLKFTEKYATPMIIGKNPKSRQSNADSELLDLLDRLHSDAVAVIPENVTVEILEAQGKSSSSDIYNNFINYMDSQISKVWLGHSAAADSTSGKLGNENMAEQVRDDLIKSDSRMIENGFNDVIEKLVKINFGDVPRPVFQLYEKEDVDQDVANRDATLSGMGVKFTKEYYINTYNFQETDFEVTEPETKEDGKDDIKKDKEYSEAGQDVIESVEGDNELSAEIIKPFLDMINESNDFSELLEKSKVIWKDIDTKKLEDVLRKAIFSSSIVGQNDSDIEVKE